MNQHHKLYVGIDAHSETHKVALIPSSALQGKQIDFHNSELMDVCNSLSDFKRLSSMIKKYSSLSDEVVIGIDSCGVYTMPLTYHLQGQKYHVYYMEQKLSKAVRGYLFDVENKNDVIDAIRIAYLLYIRDMSGSSFRATALTTPDFDNRAYILHTLVLHRRQYDKLVAQSTNRLHVFLTAIFPEAEKKYFAWLLKILPFYPTPREIVMSRGMKKVKGVGIKIKKSIKDLAKETVGIPADDHYRQLILNLCKQREQALTWQTDITESIKKEVNEHPYGSILMSFPYCGCTTAATIIGIIGDIERWPSEKQLKKAFGLYASFQQSGKSTGVRKQGLRGDRLSKASLYLMVLLCLRTKAMDNDFRDYYRGRVSRGKPKMSAIVATMGKLTEIIYHCLKTGEHYCYKGTYKRNVNKIKSAYLDKIQRSNEDIKTSEGLLKLPEKSDPVLSEIWDDETDAAYDRL